MNGQNMIPGLIYTFDHGASIRNSAIESIYYSDVTGKFSEVELESRVLIKAENVTFRFGGSTNGRTRIHDAGSAVCTAPDASGLRVAQPL